MSNPDHVIYSKRYWDASPSWPNWNKLSALSIHNSLRTEPGFEGQNVYFYGNNPIQFVRVVGVLVQIEKHGRYTILTVDDSSGACIEVKIEDRNVKAGDMGVYPSNSVVDNVDVKLVFGMGPCLYLTSERKHKGSTTATTTSTHLEIGSILEVKGTISTFRNERQITLKRLFQITSTNAEAAAWAKTAAWERDILSQPWILTKQKREEIDKRIGEEEKVVKAKEREKRRWEIKHKEKVGRHEEKRRAKEEREEIRRKKKEVELNEGALKGSGAIVAPWE